MPRPLTKSKPHKVRIPLDLEPTLAALATTQKVTPNVYLAHLAERHLRAQAPYLPTPKDPTEEF